MRVDPLRRLESGRVPGCSPAKSTLYTIRERQHLWSSRPGTWLIVSTIGDIVIISALAMRGIAMRPLPIAVVASTLVAALLFAFLLDLIKVPVFRRFQIA
jgi:H+-transporting ATPase